ncbi:MAG: protein-L-isoaspartate(D-aspartate) O-methyltransferase [Burkholderiaceae bacterium]
MPGNRSATGAGPDFGRSRLRMAQRLAQQGIRDPHVLDVMAGVPRHLFIDSALTSRAYQDVSLPIGHGQTISKPSIVAQMIELAAAPIAEADRASARVLEIGTGCGYQAAVLAGVFGEVVSIERVGALHEMAARRLRSLGLDGVRLVFGDGHLGLQHSAPFHAIVIAAALDGHIPEVLLQLLRVGGRLVSPVHLDGGQRLVMVERSTTTDWHVTELDAVRFVPMVGGTV